MRFAKIFALILLFVVSMIFFVQNNEILSQTMSLRLDLYFSAWRTVPLSFYFMILIAFLVGSIFVMACVLLERMRLVRQLKEAQAKATELEKKAASALNYEYKTSSYITTDTHSNNDIICQD
ncbi:lipopolysaccharide assembly protein A [Desulfovibrionales bacterium]